MCRASRLARWAALLLVSSCWALSGTIEGTTELLSKRVNGLEAEVQALRQQLHGAAVLQPDLAATGLQPFVPPTANLQRTLATRTPLWPHHWSFSSAVSTDSKTTVSHVITDGPGTSGGCMFVVLGDASGRLYFFTAAGYLLYEHDTGAGAPVTAFTSHLLRSNSTQLAVGLQQGTVLLLEVGHESARLPDGSGISSIKTVMTSTADDRASQDNSSNPETFQQPIRHLAFTKSAKQRKTLLLLDAAGRVVALLPPTGRLMLSRHLEAAPLAVHLNTDFQLVVQTGRASFVVLMHRGRGRIQRPCSGLAQPPEPASSSNTTSSSSANNTNGSAQPGTSSNDDSASNSATPDSSSVSSSPDDASGQPDVLVAAAFDPLRAYRVFGVTRGGELLALVVPSSQRTMKCKVVQRVPLGLPPGPVHLIASKNRLVLLHAAGVAAFNTSNPLKLAGSHLASHAWQDLWQLYGLNKHYSQQQQQQQQVTGQHAEDGSSSADRSCAGTLLHSTAWGTDTPLPAATGGGLLLLPLGDTAVAVFGTAGVQWGSSGGGSSADFSGADHDMAASLDWAKFLQPFVIVMMVVVGVWQFVRASNKQQLAAQRGRLGSRYSGLEGLNPDDLGSMGMSGLGLGAGRGIPDFASLDTQLGAYAGPRSNREREVAFDPYGGLGALGARRRARQVMHGRERGSGGGLGSGSNSSRGLGTQQGGIGSRMVGGGGTGRASAAGVGVRGALAGSSRGASGGAAAAPGRRVRFSVEDVGRADSGSDDSGDAPVAAVRHSTGQDAPVCDVVDGAQGEAVDGGDSSSAGGVQLELQQNPGLPLEQQSAGAAVVAEQQLEGGWPARHPPWEVGGTEELLESAAGVEPEMAAGHASSGADVQVEGFQHAAQALEDSA